MILSTPLLPFLLLHLTISSPTPTPPSPPHPYTFRPFIPTDLPSLTHTLISAFDPGTLWTYLYQFRDRFPEYHVRCILEEVRQAVEKVDPEVEFVNVIVPDGGKEVRSFGVWKMMMRSAEKDGGEGGKGGRDRGRGRGRGFAKRMGMEMVGDFSSIEEQQGREIVDKQQVLDSNLPGIDLPCSLHLDINLIRALHLMGQLDRAEKEFIEDAYEYQFYLGLLATHPDWDGHGFGAEEVEWGLEWAKEEEERLSWELGREVKVPVTLLATPAGYPLYKSLGFESVANFTIELLEGGTTWYEYMRWESD